MEQVTVRTVVEETVRILNKIMVPIEYMDSIAFPIKSAVSNLNLCINAWDKEENSGTEAEKQRTENPDEEHDSEEEGTKHE